MSESTTQSKTDAFARAQGWQAFPFRSANHRGLPDRIYFKAGKTKLIEFKDTGKKPSPLQNKCIADLRSEGMEVHVIDNVEAGKDVFRPNRSMLHGYQERAVQFIKDTPYCALWVDMGLGKTISTLTAIADLAFDFNNVLVIAPLRVAKSVWPVEVKKWAHTRHLTVNNLCVPLKQRKTAFTKQADIHVINRELVAQLAEYWGQDWPYDFVVIDESSSFKSHKSQRFKALRKVRNKIGRMVQLTGTPASNGLLDLWSQIYLLDGGQRLGKTYSAYRDAYFLSDYMGYNWHLKKGSKEKIYNRLGDITLSLASEDYLDLPERVDNFIKVEMPPAVAGQYRAFERDFLTEIDGEEVTALYAAGLANKLLQFANGAVYSGEGSDRLALGVHDLKLDALAEIIEGAAGAPVLVAYNFKSDLARIQARFKHAEVLGTEPKIIDRWNAGEIPILLAHPASAGHGLNLQDGGRILAWFGLNWSLELYQQFNKRLHRQGQERSVIVHHIVVKDSIDESVIRALKAKDATQSALLNALKKDAKRRSQ